MISQTEIALQQMLMVSQTKCITTNVDGIPDQTALQQMLMVSQTKCNTTNVDGIPDQVHYNKC